MLRGAAEMAADPSDEELLGELAEVLRPLTEPPAEVLAVARGLYALRGLDTALAALSYDSLLDDAPSGVRAAARPRILTFTADVLSVEVEVDASPRVRRLLGQLLPAQAARLQLRAADGTALGDATADEGGRFVLGLPGDRQPVRLRVTTADGQTVETAATTI